MLKTTSHNSFEFNGWILEKLCDRTNIGLFDCGNEDLNDYFHNDSLDYQNQLFTQTYCFYQKQHSQKEFVALVDFCNDALAKVFVARSHQKLINHQKRGYSSYPALKITRLAVDNTFKNEGIGTLLLSAIKHFFVFNNRTGCRFLTVDAYRNVEAFYAKNDFVAVKNADPNAPTIPMFFDLKRIAQ